MISLQAVPNASKFLLHTGNMLSNLDIIKQIKLDQTDQLIESLKTCISLSSASINPDADVLYLKEPILLNQNDDDKNRLQTLLKVFVTSTDADNLREALNYSVQELQLPIIHSVVLAYFKEGSDDVQNTKDIKSLWKILEEFVKSGHFETIGTSDMDTAGYISLYEEAEIKPNIYHINMSICCVVPQDLQDFCRKNDIRLLTHNDPLHFLPTKALTPLFELECEGETNVEDVIEVAWLTRFNGHIKHRGILAGKGYMVCLKRKKVNDTM